MTWQPRFIRQTSMLTEATSAIAIRWRTLESIALSLKLTQAAPESVIAASAESEQRNAPDFLSLNLQTDKGPAFIQVGMGESSARQETTLAVAYRKAYIDELNESVPIRITDGSETTAGGSSRWVSCPSPSPEELTRQQCLAFLEATERATLAEAEAALWARSLAVLHAADASLSEDGVAVDVLDQDQPGFRVILGQQPPQRSAGRMLPA